MSMTENAIVGMLPHNKLSSQIQRKLHVYAGPQHPHAAQQPEQVDIGAMNRKNKRVA